MKKKSSWVKVLSTSMVCAAILLQNNLSAQGLFDMFNNHILNSQKLTAMQLVVFNWAKVSPSTILEYGFTATTKKGKEIATNNLDGGEYKFNVDFKFESENASLITGDNGKSLIQIKPINEIVGNTVNIKITFKSKADEPIVMTKDIPINYEGDAMGLYKGNKGKNGSTGYKGDHFHNSGNGLNDAGYGTDGKSLDAYVKLENIGDVPFLKVSVTNNTDGSTNYFVAKPGIGKIVIDASGGDGGNGGKGGDGSFNTKPGDGSDGSDGGNGGSIILHIDPSAKPYENTIVAKVYGGKGGDEGQGGKTQLDGINRYILGNNGRAGRSGRNGKIEFKYEDVKLAWF